MARRDRARHEYIFGINPVREALGGRRKHVRLYARSDRKGDRRVAEIIELAGHASIPVELVDQRSLDSRTDGGNHQGVVLQTGTFPYTEIEQIVRNSRGRPVLVLDHVQDPQNLATLIRTAAAVDVAGVVIQSDRSAQVTPAVVRSSAGLVEQVPVARENNTRRALEFLKDHGYWSVALEATADAHDIYVSDIPTPTALVVGSEERGIAGNVLKECDFTVALPMPGRAESLNAAVAGSVALFELVRRSRH